MLISVYLNLRSENAKTKTVNSRDSSTAKWASKNVGNVAEKDVNYSKLFLYICSHHPAKVVLLKISFLIQILVFPSSTFF